MDLWDIDVIFGANPFIAGILTFIGFLVALLRGEEWLRQ